MWTCFGPIWTTFKFAKKKVCVIQNFGPTKFWSKRIFSPKNIGSKILGPKKGWSKKCRSKKMCGPSKNLCPKILGPINFGSKITSDQSLVKIRLLSAIIMKLGRMLQGQMWPGHICPRQSATNKYDLAIQPLKFGWVLTSNIRDMASFVFVNYSDPKIRQDPKFTNPVVDIVASKQFGVLFG